MSITAHRAALEALLAGLNARVDAPTYPRTIVHIDAGPGWDDSRRMTADYAAREYLVHTNVHAVSKPQCEALLDRVMGLEGLRPVVAGRLCDPLTVYMQRGPTNDPDLPDSAVWSASVVWALRSYLT